MVFARKWANFSALPETKLIAIVDGVDVESQVPQKRQIHVPYKHFVLNILLRPQA